MDWMELLECALVFIAAMLLCMVVSRFIRKKKDDQ